jgi:hypothetical protein
MHTGKSLLFLSAFIVAAALRATAFGDDDARAPVPAAAEVATAEAEIKDLFKDDLAKPKPADRIALAVKLLQQADEMKSDNADKYEMLVYARNLASKAGDVTTAVDAADRLCKSYRVKRGETNSALAASFSTATLSAEEAMEASNAFRVDAETAVQDDEYDAALTLARAAEAMGRRSQSIAAITVAQQRVRWVSNVKAEAEKMKFNQTILAHDPADAAANLALGKFCCFMKNDFDHGLPHLALGSDAKLKDAATKDAAAANGAGADKLAAADAWYAVATVPEYNTMPFLQLRMYALYSDAVKDLSGLDKTKAEHRVAEFQKVVDAQSNYLKVWSLIRNAVAAKQVKSWDFIGGAFFHQEVAEVPPAGAILIGFNYTTKDKGAFPGAIQAIYLTPSGEVKGRVFGKVEAGAVLNVTKAKPGYALGAIYVRGGGGFDAFQPIFMKMTQQGVKTDDCYDGPFVGGHGGGDGTVGDGNFVIGIRVKVGFRLGWIEHG